MAKSSYSEERWWSETSPYLLLRHLRSRGLGRLRGGKRRLRLLGCAAGRLVWQLLPDDRYRQAIVAAEQAAEAEVRQAVMVAARDEARGRQANSVAEVVSFAFQSFLGQFGWSFPEHATHQHATQLAQAVTAPGGGLNNALLALNSASNLRVVSGETHDQAQADHARLVRCIFGNPFRTEPFEAAWRTPDVQALANASADQARDRLLILADALEDAGCSSEQLLAHLRSGGAHPRGCWAVDLALGKEIDWPVRLETE
jgi:hypothetical protein